MSQGRVKGTIVIQTVKHLRSNKDESRRLLPERLHHYLEGRILPTSWHAEEDQLELMRASVQLFKGPDAADSLTVWEETARLSAPAYFEGAYRSLVRKGDPARTLSTFDSLWKLRHDTGKARVELLGHGRARLELTDYALVSEEMCASIQGTLAGLLEHSRARAIEVSHTRCRARGDKSCIWRLGWAP